MLGPMKETTATPLRFSSYCMLQQSLPFLHFKEAAFSLKSRSYLVWCGCLYQPWSSQQGAVSAWLNLIPTHVPHGNPEDICWDREHWFSLIAQALCDDRISCLSRPGMEIHVIRWTIRVSWQIWNMNMVMVLCSAVTYETPMVKYDLPLKQFQPCVHDSHKTHFLMEH